MDDDSYDVAISTSNIQTNTAGHNIGSNNNNDINIINHNNSSSIGSNNSSYATMHIQAAANNGISQTNNRHMNAVCSPHDVSSGCSDIDVDDSTVKEEPLSPGSSCPSSPHTPPPQYGINVNLANMAAYTNTDLVFEHNKVSQQVSIPSIPIMKRKKKQSNDLSEIKWGGVMATAAKATEFISKQEDVYHTHTKNWILPTRCFFFFLANMQHAFI